MYKLTQNILVLTTIFALFLGISNVSADTTSISQKMYFNANLLRDRGRYQEAVDEYARSLLVDYNNKSTQAALLDLVKRNQFPSLYRFKLITFEDLINYVDQLSNKTAVLSEQKENLRAQLIDHGYNQDELYAEMIVLEEAMPYQVLDLDEQADPLSNVNNTLSFIRDQFENKIEMLNQQISLLNNKKMSILRVNKQVVLTTQSLQNRFYDQNGKRIKGQKFSDLQPAKVQIVNQVEINQFEELFSEMEIIKSQQERLEAYVYQKDEKISELTDEIVSLSLELEETKGLINDKDGGLGELNTQLLDLQSRFDLSQRIILKKDNELESLKGRLSLQAEASLKQAVSKNSNKLRELEGILLIYKGKLKDVNGSARIKNDQIVTLQEQIEVLNDRIKDKDEIVINTRETLISLKEQMNEIRDKLSEVKKYALSLNDVEGEVGNDISSLKLQIDQMNRFLQKRIIDFEYSDELEREL